MNIPVAHIQGGEVSGNIDESLRHAMSKFSHFHFVSNLDAKKRLIRMGENPRSIFTVGCPSIDALKHTKEKTRQYMLNKYKFDIKSEYILMIQHPVTSEKNEIKNHINNLFNALNKIDLKIFIILPNNDYGAKIIINKIKNSRINYTSHLNLAEYKTLLKNCNLILGNSSSGIHEAATFKKPAVNIGTRQQGRYKGLNVIDVGTKSHQILEGIQKAQKNEFLKIKYLKIHMDQEFFKKNCQNY